MTDKQLRSHLQRLVRRASVTLMLNRLLTFLLVNAVLYILLLLLVIFADVSLLLLNLILFSSLALFPCYLLAPLPQGSLRLFIRRSDTHCLLESYLETRQAEQRRYMLRELERLLRVMSTQSIAPLRLKGLNTKLLVALLACLVCYQAVLLFRFDGFSWSFSARDLKARSLALENGGDEGGLQETAAGLEAPPTGGDLPLPQEGESAALRPEAPPPLDMTVPPGSGTDAPAGVRRISGDVKTKANSEADGETDRGQPAAPAAGAGGRVGSGVESEEPGGGETGRGQQQAGSAGRGFLESPLAEYEAALRELAARGGSELAAGSLSEAAEAGAYPRGVFGDYTGSVQLLSSLDPLLARIQSDYLRLIDERFRP
jgi:hypothetical protein